MTPSSAGSSDSSGFPSDLPTAPAPHASKDVWRAWVRNVRHDMSEKSENVAEQMGERTKRTDGANQEHRQLCQHLQSLLSTQQAQHVLAYRHMFGEPDITALEQSFTLYAPRARFRPERHLTLHHWHTATEMSRFGVLQPPADTPTIAPSQIDAILLPAMAFDQRGVRLGYGGGFYDRLLPHFQGLLIGVTWSPFVVPQLPYEPHDCPVMWIVTEQGVLDLRSHSEP